MSVSRERASHHCPSCAADFDGGPIPQEIRHNYSPPYRWSRRISVVDRDSDRAVAFECPDCHHRWSLEKVA